MIGRGTSGRNAKIRTPPPEANSHHARTHIQLGLLQFKLCPNAEGRKHMEAALKARPTLEERRLIEKTLKEQKDQDKGRYYRPDFEALHKAEQNNQSQNMLHGLKKSPKRFFK